MWEPILENCALLSQARQLIELLGFKAWNVEVSGKGMLRDVLRSAISARSANCLGPNKCFDGRLR